VTKALARAQEKPNWRCFGFNALGNDQPLFVRPQPESSSDTIAGALNLPIPISRQAFDYEPAAYYGEDKSLAIWVNGDLVPVENIVATDLTDWHYVPKDDQVAVDPELGQIFFSSKILPKRSDRVRVSYHYGFSADIGGGEYDRPMIQSPGAVVIPVAADTSESMDGKAAEKSLAGLQGRLQQALLPWTPTDEDPDLADQPVDAVIEIESNDFITIPIQLKIKENHSLQIRATNRHRPILWIPDQSPAAPDAFSVTLAPGSRLVLDGLLITNRSVYVTSENNGNSEGGSNPEDEICPAQLVIRHCTLVPGWGLDSDCNPKEPAEPSLDLDRALVNVRVEHSIIGAIQVEADTVETDPISIRLSDSILDSTEHISDAEHLALGDPSQPGNIAHVLLTMQRCTVFGIVTVHAIELAENCIFMDCLNVARRQLGCLRFCYIPPGCRTPKRYRCQPELVEQERESQLRQDNPTISETEILAERQFVRERVRPQFTSVRYGQPAYCQLANTCADEIKRGADDESEMGVFHDLFQPQREANLRARLSEYTPAGMNVGILFVS